MANEVVKYHNDLNGLSVKKWTTEEMDMFFSIISKIRDTGTKVNYFKVNELKTLAASNSRNSYWIKSLTRFVDKAMGTRYTETDGKSFGVYALFQSFKYYADKGIIEVKVSEDFTYIVNRLSANFTSYELKEFTGLNSIYSKTLYRLLKQWKTKGIKEFTLEQFVSCLNIPNSYNISSINRAVIGPIKKELSPCFDNFNVFIIKGNTQGTPVIGYRFTWTPEKTSSWEPYKFYKNNKNEISSGPRETPITDKFRKRNAEKFRQSRLSLSKIIEELNS